MVVITPRRKLHRKKGLILACFMCKTCEMIGCIRRKRSTAGTEMDKRLNVFRSGATRTGSVAGWCCVGST